MIFVKILNELEKFQIPIFGKIPKYLGKFRNIWKTSEIIGKIPKYLEKFPNIQKIPI